MKVSAKFHPQKPHPYFRDILRTGWETAISSALTRANHARAALRAVMVARGLPPRVKFQLCLNPIITTVAY